MATIFCREYGQGKDVLMILHGLMGMSDNWVTFSKKISAGLHLKVLLPDLPGHGQSIHLGSYSYPEIINHLNKIVTPLNPHRMVIAGHSYGGLIAMQWAASFPCILNGLMVLDMAPRAYTTKGNIETLIDYILNLELNKFSTLGALSAHLDTAVSRTNRDIILKNIKKDQEGNLAWKFDLQLLAGVQISGLPFILPPFKFKKPSVFLKGEHSSHIRNEDVALINDYYLQTEIIEVPAAGHWLHTDAPETLYCQFVNFYNRLNSDLST